MNTPWLTAVVAAAGLGQRFGWHRNKVFYAMGEEPILARTLRRLAEEERICDFIVAVGKEDLQPAYEMICHMELFTVHLPEQALKDSEKQKSSRHSLLSMVKRFSHGLSQDHSDESAKKRPLYLVVGGARREDSTFAALQCLPEQTEWVITHDGARPFVSKAILDRLITRMEKGDASGVICTVPLKDTVKFIQEDWVQSTPPRNRLRAVQTPQIFARKALVRSYEKLFSYSDAVVTDDAQIVAMYGGQIACVEGEYTNIKVTTPEDVWLAHYLEEHEEKQ